MTCRIDSLTGRKHCSGTDDIPACQLCPESPSYWRNFDPPPPVEGAGIELVELPKRVALDWTKNGPDGAAPRIHPPRPCVLCRKPSILLSPRKKVPMHKVCAEGWYEQHPEARERITDGTLT